MHSFVTLGAHVITAFRPRVSVLQLRAWPWDSGYKSGDLKLGLQGG